MPSSTAPGHPSCSSKIALMSSARDYLVAQLLTGVSVIGTYCSTMHRVHAVRDMKYPAIRLGAVIITMLLSSCYTTFTLLVGCASVQDARTYRINLLGEVERPGFYEVRGDICVAEIVKLGGGLVRSMEGANHFRATFREEVSPSSTERGAWIIVKQDRWTTPLSKIGIDLTRYSLLNIGRSDILCNCYGSVSRHSRPSRR